MTDALVRSYRQTSNSRGPGQSGTLYLQPRRLSRCPKCATLRYGEGRHAPHWKDGVLVDCAGEAVR